MKHTPGPWTVYDMCLPARKCVNIMWEDGEIVAVLPQKNKQIKYYTLKDLPELAARARLIAAAPKMLWMLKDILGFLKRSGYDTQMVEAAIAEAE